MQRMAYDCNAPSFDVIATLLNRSHAGIIFTPWSKNGVFARQGRHVVPMNVQFGTGEWTVPVPNFTFIGAAMWEYSPQNCPNFEFWPYIFPQGRLVCTIFTKFLAFVRVYR